MVVNSFLLSFNTPAAKEDKFSTQLAFKEALYKDLFAAATASTIVAAPTIAAAGIADIVEHQRVKIKRAPCVVCKQAAAMERQGIKQQRRQPLQAVSSNFASRSLDRHVSRALTGCASSMVALCTKKRCWEVFHLGVSSGGAIA